MGNLSAALLAEILAPTPGGWLDLVATMVLPDGTSKRFSRAPSGLEVLGGSSYPGLVDAWGTFSISADFGRFGMDKASRALRVIDRDRWLSRLDALGEPLSQCVVTTQLGAKHVPAASWFTLHQGTINPAGTSIVVEDVCSLQLDPTYAWLDRPLGWPITEADWPDAPKTSVGQLAPFILGLWDASAGDAKGSITLVPLSSDGTVWAVPGWLYSVDRVYADDALKTETTHYTIDHPLISGRRWTRVTFAPALAATAVVKIDCHGQETVGDGTGEMVVDPTELAVFALANLGYDDNPGLAWGDGSSAPLDLTSAAEVTAFHDGRANGAPFVAALLLAGDSLSSAPTGWQITEWYQRGWGVAVTLGFDGKLHFSIENPHDSTVPTAAAVIESQVESATFGRASWPSVRRVSVRYGRSATQEARLVIVNAAGDVDSEETVDLTASGPGMAR